MMDKERRTFLRATGATMATAALYPSIARALAIPAARRSSTIMDVRHVVILMQENRSFDHYYGTLRGVQGFADPWPVPLPGDRLVWDQRDKDGALVRPFHLDTGSTAALKVDVLPHSWEDATGASHRGRWDSWIPWKGRLAMGHYRREDIPFQFALAEAFTICDAYHCSVHGQTNPNRIFLWAGGNDPRGTGGGPVIDNGSGVALDRELVITPEMVAMAERHGVDPAMLLKYGKGERYRFRTYPERLEEAGVSWKVYQDPADNFDGLTNPAVAFRRYNDAGPGDPLHDKAMSHWTLDDLRADALAGRMPQVSWVASPQSASEHPYGSSPIEGARFTAQVLDALTANPDIWASTALFLMFDENDGFFDHVPPPSPPGANADGGRSGASTVDTADDLHRDGTPYGLSVRVPMTVVSPWSTGGWVNSEVFDHTSVIRFLEKRFGVMEPNITPWRRAVCGDLTSAFDFAAPQSPRLSLPDTSDAAARVEAALKLPKPIPPVDGALSIQEAGVRPSRALPYAPEMAERLIEDGMELRFGNRGKAGIVYQVHDLDDLAAAPRHYTVEPGKTLTDRWTARSDYHLQVRGPNRWYRELRGRADGTIIVTAERQGDALRVAFANGGGEAVALRCRDTLRPGSETTVIVPPGGAEWSTPIADRHFWYDVVIDTADDGFYRRFGGRVETGRDGLSWPGG